jgi:hypothetical protein
MVQRGPNARSPDLNPCDFLWGHLKQLVYSQPITSVEELTNLGSSAQIQKDREVFPKVRGSMARITHQRQHFHHLL